MPYQEALALSPLMGGDLLEETVRRGNIWVPLAALRVELPQVSVRELLKLGTPLLQPLTINIGSPDEPQPQEALLLQLVDANLGEVGAGSFFAMFT